MRLVPRRDHPSRRALRAVGRRVVAALGLKSLRRRLRVDRVGRITARTGVGPGHRIVFVSGEPDTPGHTYRVARFAKAAVELGHTVDVIDIDDLAAGHCRGLAPKAVFMWRTRWSGRLEQAITPKSAASPPAMTDDDAFIRGFKEARGIK